ncbi:DNA-binding protein [Treponema putidum]|uniref:DNA-binding protein n=2 Tax=Treponema putidum TaxID=221027 RepID=A0ABY5HU75_9SPIR|nr:DNA-binding protein [Treponema putidum]
MTILESEGLEEELMSLQNTLSISEAAFFLRVNYHTIYRLICSGQLKAYKNGDEQNWRISKESLIRYSEKHETIN